MPFERTLIVGPGVAVPWNLVPAGLRFLERWEAAAPMEEGLAATIGTAEERERTRAITRDLRVPVYEPGLLFLRDCAAGKRLLEMWQVECADGAEPRLALLRALYQVKPVFLALPRVWLRYTGPAQPARRSRGLKPGELPLVRVQIGPGRFVRCRQGEEARTLARYQHLQTRRAERGKR